MSKNDKRSLFTLAKEAVNTDDSEWLRSLLIENHALAVETDKDGNSLALVAAKRDLELHEKLKNDDDPSVRREIFENERVFFELLYGEADLNTPNKKKEYPVLFIRNPNIVIQMSRAGMNTEAVDKQGNTSLGNAVANENMDLAEAFAKSNANINHINPISNKSILDIASNPLMIEMLCRYGAGPAEAGERLPHFEGKQEVLIGRDRLIQLLAAERQGRKEKD